MRMRLLAAIALVTLAAIGTFVPGAWAKPAELPLPLPFTLHLKVRPGANLGPGLFLLDPHQVLGNQPSGPTIVDNRGRVVWFHPAPEGETVANFRVQRYEGKPVLTWWQGKGGNPAFGAFAPGIGEGEDIIMNDHYKIIKVIKGSDGLQPDSHDFYITPNGTALITAYRAVPHVDLTSVHGPADGTVVDSVVREIDIKTGKVLLDWSALAHVPISDSHALPLLGASPWDFFHVNAVSLAPNGDLLISARHMWALYEVDPSTGAVVSTIGGKQSDFSFGPDASFAWQHDAHFVGKNEIAMFDNESGIPFAPALPYSRALWIRLDFANHTATLARQIIQPSTQLPTGSQGGVQDLPDGRTVVSWGSAGSFSEYNRAGNMLAYAQLPDQGTLNLPNGISVPSGWQTYRVFKQSWTGTPTGPPLISAEATQRNHWTVSAAWNGATQVTRWRILAGSTRRDLQPVVTKPWKGLITNLDVNGSGLRFLRLEALDAHGSTLGRSRTLRTH